MIYKNGIRNFVDSFKYGWVQPIYFLPDCPKKDFFLKQFQNMLQV